MIASRRSRIAINRKSQRGAKSTIAALLSAATKRKPAAAAARARVAGRQRRTQKLANSRNQIELVTLSRDSTPTTGSSTTIAASAARKYGFSMWPALARQTRNAQPVTIAAPHIAITGANQET